MSIDKERIPDAERDVLACLGRLGSATVQELRAKLQPIRKMEAGSVLTLLKRLEVKKLVSKEKAPTGKAFIFKPTKNSGRAYNRLMKDLFQRAFGGDTVAFMASFFETGKPTDKEIDQMEELLAKLRSKRNSKQER